MIEIKNLSKKYKDVQALDGVSFSVNQGEILGFLGPNGAGKTTTMKIITGFISANSGSIQINGLDSVEDSLEIRKQIGYLPENVPLYEEMKVYEYLKFVGEARGLNKGALIKKIKELIQSCSLEKVIRKNIGELSKGYKQRVGLAQALIHDPKILILDEPTEGLDPNQIVEIRNLIKKMAQEKTVIMCSHILSEVQATCSRIVIINEGKIVAQGTTEELKAQSEGKQIISFALQGNKEEVIEKFQVQEGVLSIKSLGKESAEVEKYILETRSEKDLRPLVFNLAKEKDWTLYNLTSQELSLEDVFRKLTK
jgi:ABC-2 type transport system ATP-binding protein